MNAILVFDYAQFSMSCFSRERFKRVDIFPLTANWDEINLVAGQLKKLNIETRVLNSAALVSEETARHRDNFIEWAAEISNYRIKEKTVRERLMLKGSGLSAWWLGLLADKDPGKNRVFLRIAQTAAILKCLRENKSDTAILALKDSEFQQALVCILGLRKVNYLRLRQALTRNNLLNSLKALLKPGRYFMGWRDFLAVLCKIIAQFTHVKRNMPRLSIRKKTFDNAFIFFTYFPAVLKQDSQKGIFKNRFALPLQEVCQEKNKQIVWILMYSEMDNFSFSDAVKLARRFEQEGQDIFFWYEFLSLADIFKGIKEYLRVAQAWNKIRPGLNQKTLSKLCENDYAWVFLLQAMDDSFAGGRLIEAIIQFEAFKKLFTLLTKFSHGIYLCEMMSWEMALLAASKESNSRIYMIGYQDFAISQYYLQMFHSRQELKYKNTPSGIPMPDTLAGCGSIPRVILKRYYDEVGDLEALRHLYLNDFLKSSKQDFDRRRKKDFVLTVFTGIDPIESKALVSLIKEAYPERINGLKIWFKGHPALNIEEIFRELKFVLYDDFCQVKSGDLSEIFRESDAALIGASSVAIDALAFGCKVLVYFNCETLNQTPLIGFEELYHRIYGAKDLRLTIEQLRAKNEFVVYEKFVRNYWNLDSSLSGWRNILNLH